MAANRGLFLLMATLLGSGCAGIDFQPAVSKQTNGIRYYRPATYWLITPDYENGTAKLQAIHAPDISETFAAKPYAWFAQNTSSLEFENGMLKTVESDAKSAAVVVHTIQAATGLATKLLEAAAQAARAASVARLAAPQPPNKTPENAVFLFMDDGSGIRQLYP